MWKIVSLFLLPFIIFAHELEVRLQTRSSKKSLYLSRFKTEASVTDWRYIDELRSVLEFDLNVGGFVSFAENSEDLENNLKWPDTRDHFDLAKWRNQHIPYVLTVYVKKNSLSATVFDIEEGTSKKYPEIAVTGNLDADRRSLHHLSDTLHKDLFGIEGIASLKVIYAHRSCSGIGCERKSEVWIVDYDGANPKQLTFDEDYCVSPYFFPTTRGSQFFYVSFKEGQSKIYRFGLRENQKLGELMLSLRGNQLLPTISNDGRKMAFISDVAGRPDLFLQNLDKMGRPIGKARQIFSSPRATQASSSFSPDGKKIAFVSDKDGPPRIYTLDVMDPRETKKPRPQLITKRNRENTCPAWSLDGKKLAYSSKIDGVRQIWIYDFETEEEIQMTSGPEMKENPSWAPDNIHLIYNTESEERCELFLLDIRNPKPISISKGLGQRRFPCWETK